VVVVEHEMECPGEPHRAVPAGAPAGPHG
jgi:hypothetical protein